jgi:hypothetical protein
MKKLFLIATFQSLLCIVVFSQAIPSDSLYLVQTPPKDIPRIFNLNTSPKHSAAERITILNDSKEIFYSETKLPSKVSTPATPSYLKKNYH